MWDWVNQHTNHTFILVPKAGQCNNDEGRDPFLVTDIEFFEKSLSVKLAATRQLWEDAAPNFHIRTTHVQRRDDGEPAEANEDENDMDDEFIDEAIQASIKTIEDLDAQLADANASSSDNVFQLQREMDVAVVQLYDLVETKAFMLLDDLELAYGDRVSESVREVKTSYKSSHDDAQRKFADAERLAENDPSASWQAWEAAVNLETQAMEGLWAGFDAIIQLQLYAVEPAQDDEGDIEEKRHAVQLGVAHENLEKRIFIAPLVTLIAATVKGKGNIGIGIVKLLGVDKRPVELSLKLPKWSPKAFGATKKDDDIDFSAGPEFELGGKIIGEVEAEVKDKKPHIFRITIKPQDIFAEAGFRITADGQRSKRLEKPIVEITIPLKGAAFEIKGLIYVGPKLSAGMHLEPLFMNNGL